MALIQGSDITTEAIIERFQSTVVEPILAGAYHAGNIPTCRGYQCVPTSRMDHLDNVNTIPDVGQEGDVVSATVVLNGLIALVRNLTRVGSFTFTINHRHSESAASYLDDPTIQSLMADCSAAAAACTSRASYVTSQLGTYPTNDSEYQTLYAKLQTAQSKLDKGIENWKNANEGSGKSWLTELANMSGKVIFTQAYARTAFGAPGDTAGVEYGEIIKASNLNQLMANIYSHWYNYSREQYNGSAIVCHTSCHFNCHSNCHYNCHSACHGWTVIKNV